MPGLPGALKQSGMTRAVASPPARPVLSRLLVGLLLLISMFSFDNLAVTAIMPGIEKDLGGAELYGAVFSTFLLCSLFSVIWAGEQIDRRGPFLPYVLGCVTFLSGNLVAAVAPNMWSFVFSRGLQGFGGGLITAVVYAAVNVGFAERQRPLVLSLLSMTWALPGLIAPAIAGLVADTYHWRYNFGGLGVLIVVAAGVSFADLRRLSGEHAGNKSQESLASRQRQGGGGSGVALLLAVSVGAFLHFASLGYSPERVVVLLASGAAALWSLSEVAPRLWRMGGALEVAVVIRFVLAVGFYAIDVFLPRMLVNQYGLSLSRAGVVLTAAALAWSSCSLLQAMLSRRFSTRALSLGGLTLLIGGLTLLMLLLARGLSFYLAYVAWALAGAGMGFAFNTLLASSMKATRSGNEGRTATLNGLVDALSVALAAGLGGALLNWGQRAGNAEMGTDLLITLAALALCLFAMALSWNKLNPREFVR